MSRKKQAKDKSEKALADDEKNAGQLSHDLLQTHTFEDYQCTGNPEFDLPRLCALLKTKIVPAIVIKQQHTASVDTEAGNAENGRPSLDGSLWTEPFLQVEFDSEDPLSAKFVKISGWKVDRKMARALEKLFTSLTHLQSLQFWQAGLATPMLTSLVNMSVSASLRTVTLEGNPLPDHGYSCLLSAESTLTHLSLRNNWIGDDGAHLIGSALSTPRSANKHLLTLNLASNSIGDVGAAHIAQGLRLNRALLFLSLANNRIGDPGAASLAEILCEFALTHEEVVERRKMLLERSPGLLSLIIDSDQASDSQLQPTIPCSASSMKVESKTLSRKKETPKKDERPAHKEKQSRKCNDVKASQHKGGKQADKDKQALANESHSSTALHEEQGESTEIGNPLLDQQLQYRDGEFFLPGNNSLASLNLSGNRITEKSLALLLASVTKQGVDGSMLRLCLERNRFPAQAKAYMTLRDRLSQRFQRRAAADDDK